MNRVIRVFWPLIFVIPFVLALLADAGVPLDHYNVYVADGEMPAAQSLPVTVEDQFGQVVTDLLPPTLFLVPVDKNDGGIVDPFSHLTCYDTTDPILPPPQVIATHQFGSHLLDLLPSQHLCVPTEKLIAPGPVDLDHFLCYGAGGSPLGLSVSLQDQFQQQDVGLLDPFLFCNPADKNGEGIKNPVEHLACYSYSPPGVPPGQIPILNQFFVAGTLLDVGPPFALCLPSTKELPPKDLDHFTVYDAAGPDGPVVQIVDQWQTQTTDLGPLNLFLVPADKNGEGIIDPISHLACNQIVDGEPGPQTVWAINQFGQQQLDIGLPGELCVPTEKLLAPGFVNLDHYKCYDASGPPLDIGISFADQFQAGSPTLVDPFLFCNPADKNGEGIQNPDDHLACYLTIPPGQPVPFPVPIRNQFFDPPVDIEVKDQFAFCLPSCKDSDGDTLCDGLDNCPTVANGPAEAGIPGVGNQTDVDGDGAGDACDNCVTIANPRRPAGYLSANPWATLTGDQRDDDHDGYGTRCDAKFPGTFGANVNAADLGQFRASSGKNRTGDTCGTLGTRPCAIFDLDEGAIGNLINAQDLGVFRALQGAPPGPKCPACTGTGSIPLPCVAGTAGQC